MAIRWIGPCSRCYPVPSRWTRTWGREEDGWMLRYHSEKGWFLAFRFTVDGSEVYVSHHGFGARKDIASVVLGPVVGVGFWLRNVPCLHGGAVVVRGGAMLLLGASETGKSTLIAALVDAGQPLLCEEVTVLEYEEGKVSVLPGHPLLKLSPWSLESLNKPPESLPRVFPVSELTGERWLDASTLPGDFNSVPVPAKVVYLLGGRSSGIQEPEILPASPAEACLDLMKHLYGRAWLNVPPLAAMCFCSAVSGTVPIRKVILPEGLHTVRASARALLNDALSLPGGC